MQTAGCMSQKERIVRIRLFIASLVLVVATAAQAVDLSGTWVGTNQVVVPWCPPITSSAGPAELQITQDGAAFSATLQGWWNNPLHCVPSASEEQYAIDFAGTIDGASFHAEIPFSQENELGVVFHFAITIDGSVDEDGVMSLTLIVPTDLEHDHYPEYLIDAIVTAQLTHVPAPIPPSASAGSLWPPNHSMVDIGLIRDASTTFAVYSDEDDGGEPDAAGSLLLRAERAGTGDGRVYLIVVTTADGSSNTCLTAVVPKSQSARDLASVNEQAAAAVAQCPSPAGYFVVGN